MEGEDTIMSLQSKTRNRYFCFLIIFVSLFVVLFQISNIHVFAEEVGLNPPNEWWGLSKTAFTDIYKDYKFDELKIDNNTVLRLSNMKVNSKVVVDVYFYFGRKEKGKSYYGLNGVMYLIPVKNKKFTNSELNEYYNNLLDIVRKDNGSPESNDSSQAVWNQEYYKITVSIKNAYKAYNNSSYKTASVTYVRNSKMISSSNSNSTSSKQQSTSNASGTLKVSGKASCNNFNSVGKNWSYELFVNNQEVTNTTKSMKFNVGDTITLTAHVVEDDSYPDVGDMTKTHVITDSDLKNGFKVSMTVSVKENRGRFSGNVAEWNITFSFSK